MIPQSSCGQLSRGSRGSFPPVTRSCPPAGVACHSISRRLALGTGTAAGAQLLLPFRTLADEATPPLVATPPLGNPLPRIPKQKMGKDGLPVSQVMVQKYHAELMLDALFFLSWSNCEPGCMDIVLSWHWLHGVHCREVAFAWCVRCCGINFHGVTSISMV